MPQIDHHKAKIEEKKNLEGKVCEIDETKNRRKLSKVLKFHHKKIARTTHQNLKIRISFINNFIKTDLILLLVVVG